MPHSVFVKTCPVAESFRVAKVKGSFDISNLTEIIKEYDVNLPIEDKKWNIGLIVGSSGSGKTTIATECFSDFTYFTGFEWNKKSIIDDFPESCSVDEITTACNYVGLSSAPDWLKPFSVLSNGQKMRAELARLFVEESAKPVIYDEFTSVVDRQVAQVSSYAISKFIRRKDKQFVAVSCHRDIIEWLNPDWVYDTDTQKFSWRRLRCRPEIQLDIRQGEQSEWNLFKSYHYLSSSHNKTARIFVGEINRVPVVWCSVVHFPHPKSKKMKRIHRLVVRPDYQGFGIGFTMLNFVAEKYFSEGFDVRLVTSLKYMVKQMYKNKMWVCNHIGYVSQISKKSVSHCKNLKNTNSSTRLTGSFKYIGSKEK